MTYKVVEIFESINGEGMRAGELAVFVRFAGCNLRCSYCDTMWANEADTVYQEMELSEIVEKVCQFSVRNVTITGGEPLLQKNVDLLLSELVKKGLSVEIETNGSIPLKELAKNLPELIFTMDYKLAGSSMESHMNVENFAVLTKKDTVKFVVSDRNDLERAYEIAKAYHLNGACNLLLSPVFDAIELEEIVAFMKEKSWKDARMQIQMHKVIWDPQERGV